MPDEFSKELLRQVTFYVRMADKKRAMELVIEAIVNSHSDYIAENGNWTSASPTARRAELFAVLRVTAQKCNALADWLTEEGRKYVK